MSSTGAGEMLSTTQVTIIGPTGGEPRVYRLERSFAIVGRARECDIRLDDDDVSFRHAYLQVIGGSVLCTDLCSRTGVIWDEGPRPAEWLHTGRVAKIGPYRLQLTEDSTQPPTSGETTSTNPLESCATSKSILPRVYLEALQGELPAKRWKIDRTLTLIGRSRGCALRLLDHDVSSVHCGLLLTVDGFSVVDFLGKGGTLVNGKPVRYEMLEDGAIIEIAGFRMRAIIRSPEVSDPTAAPPDPQQSVGSPEAEGEATVVSGTEFHKVLKLERIGTTLILTFLGDASRFHYGDVHRESNTARWLLSKPEFHSVIVDFDGRDLYSAVNFTTAMNMARTASDKGGRAVLCNATERTVHVLETMHIAGLWPRVATREDALAAINAQ